MKVVGYGDAVGVLLGEALGKLDIDLLGVSDCAAVGATLGEALGKLDGD